jgi:FtsP/CotA-like multicopper oxidase with cupredoxin domain
MHMTFLRTLLAAALAAGALATPALADRPRDQDRAFEATREGRSMPLPMIERRVMPFMGGADYLGPEFRGGTYRLKFMREGRVIWIDVDAATGRIVGKSR